MCMVWYMWHVYLCVVCVSVYMVYRCVYVHMSLCDVVCMCVYVCLDCVVCMYVCVSCVCIRFCPFALEIVMFHDFVYHQGLSNFCENS